MVRNTPLCRNPVEALSIIQLLTENLWKLIFLGQCILQETESVKVRDQGYVSKFSLRNTTNWNVASVSDNCVFSPFKRERAGIAINEASSKTYLLFFFLIAQLESWRLFISILNVKRKEKL